MYKGKRLYDCLDRNMKQTTIVDKMVMKSLDISETWDEAIKNVERFSYLQPESAIRGFSIRDAQKHIEYLMLHSKINR